MTLLQVSAEGAKNNKTKTKDDKKAKRQKVAMVNKEKAEKAMDAVDKEKAMDAARKAAFEGDGAYVRSKRHCTDCIPCLVFVVYWVSPST